MGRVARTHPRDVAAERRAKAEFDAKVQAEVEAAEKAKAEPEKK